MFLQIDDADSSRNRRLFLPLSKYRFADECSQRRPILLLLKSSADNRADRKCNNQSTVGTRILDGSPGGLLGRADRTTPAASGQRWPQPAPSIGLPDALDRCHCKQEADKWKARPEKNESRG